MSRRPVAAGPAPVADVRDRRTTVILAALVLLLALLVIGSFAVGRYPVSVVETVRILASSVVDLPPTWPAAMETVVLQIRLPRIAAAVLVGGALATAGAAYQTLFRNPLVSPALLGVSAGAGLGAVSGLLLSWPWLAIQGVAFLGGLLAVTTTLSLASIFRTTSLTVLVLAGLVVSAFLEALIALAKYFADPIDRLPAITFWLLGGLARVGPRDVVLAAVPTAIALAALYAVRWQVSVVGVGEDEAATLGVSPVRVRILVVVATTLLTAPAVSIAGIVGWVGLLVPHLGRMLVGPRFHVLMPASFLLGGLVLLGVDDLVRSLSIELPLGAVTALVGAPVFLLLMFRFSRGWA